MTKVVKIFEDSPGNEPRSRPGTAALDVWQHESIEVEGTPSLGAFSFSPMLQYGNAAGGKAYTMPAFYVSFVPGASVCVLGAFNHVP